MLQYLLLAMALLMTGAALTTGGFVIPAALLFPLPVGLCWARGQFVRALGLMVIAAVAALLPTGSPGWAAVYVIVADLGIFLGAAAQRRWPFGWCVAVLTAVWFALALGNVLLHWEVTIAGVQAAWQQRIDIFEEMAKEQAEAGKEISEGSSQLITMSLWIREHLKALFLGGFFGACLLTATAMTWVFQQALRREGLPRLAGSFSRMRPPEWLVWVAIALAGMWFIEYRWPNELLRNVTWNAALGLSFVYWLNGLSIVTAAMLALQWHPLLMGLCIGMLMAAQLGTALGVFGLFDTWYEFRARIDRFLAARRANGEPPMT
jgi:hypothetical protein